MRDKRKIDLADVEYMDLDKLLYRILQMLEATRN